MTEIVFKPEKGPVVSGRGLYRAYMNRKPLDLLFRAKNASEADAQLQYLFREQTKGKTLLVPEELLVERSEYNATEENKETAEQPATGGAADTPGADVPERQP